MRKRDKLLAPVKRFKDCFSRSRSGQHDPSGNTTLLKIGEQGDTPDHSQLPETRQGPTQRAEPLPPSQSVTSEASVLVRQAENLPLADTEGFSADLEEKPSVLSSFAFFTCSALGVVEKFSDPCPPLKYAVDTLLVVMEGFEKVDAVQDDFHYAAQRLTSMKSTYETHRSMLDRSDKMRPCLEGLARAIQMVEKMVNAKSKRGILQRIWEYPNDIKAVSNALRMLGDVADYCVMNANLSTHVIIQDIAENQILNTLTCVEHALFLSIPAISGCTEGTRTELLTDLLAWGTAPSDVPRVCLLNGPAGSGKSTIAHTVCSLLQGLDLLGGSFFCSRDDDDKRRSAQCIFSTLARSLASKDRGYASALVQVLQKNVGAGSFVAKEQLTKLILGPIRELHSTQQASVQRIRVVVIDALDECADDDKKVYDLMSTLLAKCDGLPLKFLITSRPESRINRAFYQAGPDRCVCHRVEDIPESIARSDVLIYLRSELAECAKACDGLDGWPPFVQVQALAKQAGTLFIYASTACKYIWNLDDDVAQRLDELTTLGTHHLRGIDPMYEFVLRQVRQTKNDATWETTRRCLQAIVRLRRQLSLGDLAELMDVDCRQLRTALAGLQSVISIPSSDDQGALSVFHASFPDYLVDEKRSHDKPWYLDSTTVHTDMLRRCLAIMKTELRFNISNSHTSYASNAEQRTQHTISGALLYSCLHWIDHLEGCDNIVVADMFALSELLCKCYLYWLEVLSATSSVQAAPLIMMRLHSWMAKHINYPSPTLPQETHSDDQYDVKQDAGALAQGGNRELGSNSTAHDLIRFASDARAFVNAFSVPIESSCPHIYLSALAATSRESKVWSGLSVMFQDMPVTVTLQPHGISSLYILRGHDSAVGFVLFSPDGTRIVSGSDDQTIRLWNAVTGAAIGEPLCGHETSVLSMSFSPDGARLLSISEDQKFCLWDVAAGATIGESLSVHEDGILSIALSSDGTRIVSGSNQSTLRLWDVTTRAAVGESMRGHADYVSSVAFSIDGTRIVSGSYDHTIRLWNASTGAAIGEPLRGHTSWVQSVAFSRDGTSIVSGSYDQTIRLWDTATGAPVGLPLHGHEDSVRSVAFSPNGKRIVSGSDDRTIRLWNVETGASIGEPLRGHEATIWSVAFSPDGTRIVSGSEDHTIRVWDSDTEVATQQLPLGFEASVTSVAFSPNGTRVISGSGDQNIRLWNATTGEAIGKPLSGHEDSVMSVAFSPDGTRVISGSEDQTIRVWNATTGEAIGEPLHGHEHAVMSVAVSPDGTRIVSGSRDQTIRLWDAATGVAFGEPLRGHAEGVRSVAFSPDSTRIVSGSFDQNICLWGAVTGDAIGEPLRGHEDLLYSVAFSPDGTRIVSGSSDNTIRLWDAATGVPIGEPLRGHADWVRSVGFSPDGTRIVSGSDDHTIRLWNAAAGAAIGEPLRGHVGTVMSVAFSPDGRRIVSGSYDQTIRLWDVAIRAAIAEPLRGQGSPESRPFLLDSAPVASASLNDDYQCLEHDSFVTLHDLSQQSEHSPVMLESHPGQSPLMEGSRVQIHSTGDMPVNRVAFSSNAAHSTSIDNLIVPGRDLRDTLTLGEDGWLRGPSGELFLWILPEYRRGLWMPRTTAIIGTHPVMLDLSQFAHGEDWTRCFSPDAEGTH